MYVIEERPLLGQFELGEDPGVCASTSRRRPMVDMLHKTSRVPEQPKFEKKKRAGGLP